MSNLDINTQLSYLSDKGGRVREALFLFQMWPISMNEWKTALTAILKQLDNPQYDKMLEIVQIPKQKKTAKFREQLPKKIIEHHGVKKSICKIRDAMDQIPRRDHPVQNLLLPFVEQLKNGPKTEGEFT